MPDEEDRVYYEVPPVAPDTEDIEDFRRWVLNRLRYMKQRLERLKR